MTWTEDAARSLVDTFDGSFEAAGVVVAAACADEAGIVSHVSPGDSPADGRFEIGSVTKTMTATLLVLLDADGTLRLESASSRPARSQACDSCGRMRRRPHQGPTDQLNPRPQSRYRGQSLVSTANPNGAGSGICSPYFPPAAT
jgi:CubicO group peptidase (beta-lactamase class C family)